jgi:hypothetical protein
MPEAPSSHFLEKIMTKTLTLALLAAATISAPALAKDARKSFTKDGITYNYAVSEIPNAIIYHGRSTEGAEFHLVLRGNKVTGTANGIRVAFDAPTVEVVEMAMAKSSGMVVAAAD